MTEMDQPPDVLQNGVAEEVLEPPSSWALEL